MSPLLFRRACSVFGVVSHRQHATEDCPKRTVLNLSIKPDSSPIVPAPEIRREPVGSLSKTRRGVLRHARQTPRFRLALMAYPERQRWVCHHTEDCTQADSPRPLTQYSYSGESVSASSVLLASMGASIRPCMNWSRILLSSSARISGLFLMYWRAFSRPWPMRISL